MKYLSVGKNRDGNRPFRFVDKMLLIMKLTVFLVFLLVTATYAEGVAQRVSLSLRNVSLETVFSAISAQTNHRFMYTDEVVKGANNVNVDVKGATLEQALGKVLKEHHLVFRIIAETVLINREETQAAVHMNDQQQTVTGIVRGANGQTLSGVTVSIKGQPGSVATTDAGGTFRATVPPGSVLVFSFLGYQKEEVEVGQQTAIGVTMKEQVSELEEVEVIATGYQNLDRKLFTGAASTLKAVDAERNGIQDISRMLEGQVAGVSVQNVSGTFGAAPKIRVRGATSITGDNKPLWVIDGVILDDVVNISNEALSTGDASTLLGSSVAGLNPDDIESFTVLKDAAATAMYGAAAMNGVVVVTTKKGRDTEGAVNINYSGNYSTYIKPNYGQFDIMNSAEQMSLLIDLENKGYLNHSSVSRNSTGGIFHKMYNLMYDYDEATDTYGLRNDAPSRYAFLERYANANTDWFDLLFRSSLMHDHSLSMNTGTERSQTYVSISFLNDQGFTLGNEAKRFTVNLRNNYKISDKFSTEVLFSGNIRDQQAPGTLNRASDPVYGSYSRDFDINPYSYALNTSRLITPYDENGELEYFTREYAPFNILNELENNYLTLKLMDLKVQAGIRYQILPSLKYSIDGQYRYVNSERQHYMTEYSNATMAYRANDDGTINSANRFLYNDPDDPNSPNYVILPNGGFFNLSNNNLVSYYIRQNLEYNEQFNDHKVNFFGTMEVRYADKQNHDHTGPGIEYDNGNLVMPVYRYYKKMIESGATPYSMWYTYDRFAAFALRGAYAFKDKYSVNATVRYDGSNKMGKSRVARWLPTWNVSGAWDISQEDFFNENPILSAARIRGTYGLVANIGNASNSAAVFYNQTSYRPYESEREGTIAISSLENSELTWEKMYEFNVGTDLGFLNNRVDLHVDYYRRNNFDLIGSVRTSGIGGQFTKTANYADMKGYGYEIELGGYPIQRVGGLAWRTQFSLGFNKTEITKLDVTRNIWELIAAEGGALLGGPHRGLYSLNFERLSEERGYPIYTGADGTPGTTYFWLQDDETDFLVYEGPVDPTLTGGFFNRFDYKNFTFSFLFKFGFGNKVRLQPSYSATYSDLYNVSKDLINRWIYYGDEYLTVIPSVLDGYASEYEVYSDDGERNASVYTYNAYNYSTERVAKGDYIRLSQVSLGYMLPASFASRVRMKAAQLNLVANNVVVLYSDKKLNGVDPEFYSNGGVALPLPRQITLSLKLGF